LANKFRYFFREWHKIVDDKDWLRSPISGGRIDGSRHWSQTITFDPKLGDIKFIWEPSRFAWAYTLVRAYNVTQDDRYAEKFWQLFESWSRTNQPNCGPNFACGQECAIRLMAMCFAFFGLKNAPFSTNEKKTELYKAIAIHAARIDSNISFAISTRTNHSITEAAGLYTAGLLFPEMKNAVKWLKRGKKIITKEGFKQIYKDGSYLQHSMNYHRLMLQDFLWVLRLAELNNDEFCDELILRVTRATEFLYQMQNEDDGRVPNYGANDGALIIPLNNCDYLNYRPVLQCCWYLLKQQKLYESGPWDEDLLWFFGSDSLKMDTKKAPLMASAFRRGGYYTIRKSDSWALIRCHTYRDRMTQIDPLHFDLWSNGINLLRDSGSYKYYAPNEPELEEYFKSIKAHNTVTIDDDLPVKAITNFTYYPKLCAVTEKYETVQDMTVFRGINYAYARKPWQVIHNRVIHANNEEWTITDSLRSDKSHFAEIRWHLHPQAVLLNQDDNSVRFSLPVGWRIEVVSDNKAEIKVFSGQNKGGWESLYYGSKQPLMTISVKADFDKLLNFKTNIYKEN
jgi:hypothetical protein